MNVNLIFPPLTSPSCVPIGIASLKSYIEKRSPRINVNLIDLNLSFVNRILDGRLDDLPRLCKKCKICVFQASRLPAKLGIFKKAKSIIRDKELFFDQEIFVKYIGFCYDEINAVNKCIVRMLNDYIEGKLREEKALAHCFESEIAQIMSRSPGMAAFSVLENGQLSYALALAKMVRQRTRIPIIFGGPALFNYNVKELMQAFGFIDFVIMKEGELAFAGLVQDKDRAHIPNLVWRQGSSVIMNDTVSIKDLDSLPAPDFDGLRIKEYFSPQVILPVSSSRGCPWSGCKFCQLNVQYSGPYREISVEKVVDNISVLKKKYGAQDFFFTDSEISARRIKELGEEIISRGLKISFACYTRPTKALSMDILKTAHKAGARFFQLGIESFSDRLLKFVNKGTTAGSVREVLKNTSALKIKNLAYLMACLPSQTRKELSSDLKQAASMQEKYGIFSVMYCLYGMGIHQGFYKELKSRGALMKPRRPAFITRGGQKVSRTDWLNFSCGGKGAYHILGNRGKAGETASAWAELDRQKDASGLNSGRNRFILVINNFLFETQLLYAKLNDKLWKSSPAKEKALKFYAEKKADIICYLCKAKKLLRK